MTCIANERFWGDATPMVSRHLTDCFKQYDWHYIVDVESPDPACSGWVERFRKAIDTDELFPHGIRYTPESPGLLPVFYDDKNRKKLLTVVIAVPPGAFRCSVSAFEQARPVFEKAARAAFIRPQLRVRLATPMQIESLLGRIDFATVEFTTAFVREHHESWHCG